MTVPPGWTSAPLAEVAEVVLGQSPPGSSYNGRGEGIPFFQGKAEFGDLVPEVRKWTTQPKKLARAGDILLSVRAPVGPTNLAPCDCAIGRGLAAIRPIGDLDDRYLLWALRATSRLLAHQATGTTFPAVSGKAVRNHVIPLAPPAHQRRLVEAIEEQFSRLDAARRGLDHVRIRLERLKESVLANAVSTSWPEVAMGDVIREARIGLDRARRLQTHEGPGVGYIRMNHLGPDGELTLDPLTFVAVSREELEKYALRSGDLLFNTRNSIELVGKVGIVRNVPSGGLVYNNNMMRIRTREDVRTEFLWIVMRTPSFRRKLGAVKSATTNVAAIYASRLMPLPVPIPPLTVQRAVIEQLQRTTSVLAHTWTAVDLAEKRAKSLRRTVLRDAFAGRLTSEESLGLVSASGAGVSGQ